MPSSKNIIVGAGRLYIGTSAAVRPAIAGGTPYSTTLNSASGWRDAGYTQEGVEFNNEPEFTDVPVDQLLDSARIFKSGIRNTVSTTLAEATLENLLVVWGQSDSTLTATSTSSTLNLVSGELGESPNERQLIVVGNGKEGANGVFGERIHHFYRALSVEASSFAQRRNEATVFPVSFRLLPNDFGSYGTFHERLKTW